METGAVLHPLQVDHVSGEVRRRIPFDLVGLVGNKIGPRGPTETGVRMLEAFEDQARALGITTLRLETNKTLQEAIALYRSAGYRQVAAFNDDPYATHWFEKRLRRRTTS